MSLPDSKKGRGHYKPLPVNIQTKGCGEHIAAARSRTVVSTENRYTNKRIRKSDTKYSCFPVNAAVLPLSELRTMSHRKRYLYGADSSSQFIG